MAELKSVLIIGPEGSGSTILKTAFSRIPEFLVLGDLTYDSRYFESEMEALFAAIELQTSNGAHLSDVARAILGVWHAERVLGDRLASPELYEVSRRRFSECYRKLIDCARERGSTATHVISKFSQPYRGQGIARDHPLAVLPEVVDAPLDQRFLDLFGLPWPFLDASLIVLRRDPKASAYSQLRRNFYPNIRVAAKWTELGLTWICSQLRTRNRPFLVIDYEDFGKHNDIAGALQGFLGISSESLLRAFSQTELKSPRGTPQWREKLSASDRAFLTSFFCPARLQQWEILFSPKSLWVCRQQEIRE